MPFDERSLTVLSSLPTLALFHAALDGPIHERDLPPDASKSAEDLLSVGLLRRVGQLLYPGQRHLRDADLDAPGRLPYRRAVLALGLSALTETGRALSMRPDAARAGIGMVRLPDTPDALAQAANIIAEAEDKLRALASQAEPAASGETVRVVLFLGSTAPRDDLD